MNLPAATHLLYLRTRALLRRLRKPRHLLAPDWTLQRFGYERETFDLSYHTRKALNQFGGLVATRLDNGTLRWFSDPGRLVIEMMYPSYDDSEQPERFFRNGGRTVIALHCQDDPIPDLEDLLSRLQQWSSPKVLKEAKAAAIESLQAFVQDKSADGEVRRRLYDLLRAVTAAARPKTAWPKEKS